MKKVRFLGLDVHAETIAVAIAEPDGEVRSLGIIPNREESIRKLVKKLGPAEQLQACYEAGPTGYVLYWQLTALGVKCEVVAPTLVPVKAGDRVKTDRRDATLARSYRAGDLTAVWVPNEEHEALRDLVRAREAAKQDQLRARHRLSKFLLRQGRRAPAGIKVWTQKYQEWIKKQVHFEQPAQEYTLLDYLHEVEHMADRIRRLEQAPEEAVKLAPRVRGDLAIRGGPTTDGIQRCGLERALQRQADATWSDHQDRQCSSAADSDRGGMGLPTPAHDRAGVTQTARGPKRRSQRNRLESATPTAQALPNLNRSRQGKAESCNRGGARATGLYLGDRSSGRAEWSTSRIK